MHHPDQQSAPPVRRRALHRFATVLTLCLALAFAGQSTAQAASGAQAYQAHALARLGGNGGQSSCLNQLWQHESGWNPAARNRTSSAYGIPQLLNATWRSTGIAKTSDPYRQVDAGLVYITRSHGSPCGAWAFWRAHRWY